MFIFDYFLSSNISNSNDCFRDRAVVLVTVSERHVRSKDVSTWWRMMRLEYPPFPALA